VDAARPDDRERRHAYVGRLRHSGKGRLLDEYLGPPLAPVVMPVYYECVKRALPVYTIAHIDDIYGHIVA
jgi:hypothetical protein